jgi:hypothetical protein
VADRRRLILETFLRPLGEWGRSSTQNMNNPYEPGTTLTNDRFFQFGRPWLFCAIATIVAMPVWFVGLIAAVDAIKPIDNPAGIPVYVIMCLALSVFVVPINAFATAPTLARFAFASYTGATIVHFIVGTAAFGLLWVWPMLIGKVPALTLTIIPYYLSIFLLPPMLVGSLAYSLRSVALNRRKGTNNPMDRSGGSAAS